MNIIDIEIPAKDYTLQGKILRQDNSTNVKPIIFVIHGWTSQMAGYELRFSDAVEMGYTVLVFDMRGHGKTGGDLKSLSPEDHQDDCQAALDYISQLENIDKNNITVYGSSYGGYQSAILSRNRTFQKLILKAPGQYADENYEIPNTQRSEETTKYRLSHHTSLDNSALRSLNAFSGKLLFVECEKDERLPKQVMNDYRAVITQDYTYELIKGADHSLNNPGTEEAMKKAMNLWLGNNL